MGSSDNGAKENEERLFLIEYNLWGRAHTTRKATKPGNTPEKCLVETCLS